MDKITIERETLLPCPFCGDDGDKGRQEVTQMIEGRNKFARITCRACGAMCPEENWNRRAALAAQPAEPSMRPLPDHDNHHNALKCPYCNPRGLKFAEPAAAQPADIVNPISQQEPVAWRHSKTGRPYELEEEVPLADGDEWAEPLYAAPATQQAPAAWRQWSTKLHDWDYQTNRGDLRPDTPADPLFVAAAQLVPLTDEQRNDRIEAWSSQGWGDRLGEVVRICIAIERAHGIAAAGDKP